MAINSVSTITGVFIEALLAVEDNFNKCSVNSKSFRKLVKQIKCTFEIQTNTLQKTLVVGNIR